MLLKDTPLQYWCDTRDTILPSDQLGHSWANVSYGTLGSGLIVKRERRFERVSVQKNDRTMQAKQASVGGAQYVQKRKVVTLCH